MSWKSPHPDDAPREGPWPEEGDEENTIDAEERLMRVERSLSSLRPRPPRLAADDWEAIRAAAAEPAATERAPDAPVRTASVPNALHRPIPTIVGSWTCGALAGALAMFFLMAARQPSSEPSEPVAGPRVVSAGGDASVASGSDAASASERAADARESDATETAAPPRRIHDVPRSMTDEEALVAMITDPFAMVSELRFTGTPTPRAGMLLRSTRDVGPQAPASATLADDDPRTGGPSFASAARRSSAAFVAAPEATRQRILDELLNENGRSTF